MKLRPYQKEIVKSILKTSKKLQFTLLGAPTGAGKSIITLAMVKKMVNKKSKRVMVIAPRRKLVRQLTATMSGFSPQVIMGQSQVNKHGHLYIASMQTLQRRLTSSKNYIGKIDMIILDEVHMLINGKGWQTLKKAYPNATYIGMTATPTDAQGYRIEGWDKTIYPYQTQDLIDMGFLVPVKVLVEDTPEGLDEIPLVGGDYNEGQLAHFMSEESRVRNIYEMWNKYCTKRKTMVFAVNIAHANVIYEDFKKHGVRVGIVHSELDEKYEDETLAKLKSGEIQVIINVGKLTTGFDEPSVDALIMAKATKSLPLYLQCLGRSYRLYSPLTSTLSKFKDRDKERLLFVAKDASRVKDIKRQLKKKGVYNVDVIAPNKKIPKGYDIVEYDVEPDKEDALILDLAGTVQQHGYPTRRRDFDRVRPPRAKGEAPEFKDVECFNCNYTCQARKLNKEVIETKEFITKRKYCPNCGTMLDEVVESTKEIERMRLVKDYTNTSKVTDEQVGQWIVMLQEYRGYKDGWTAHLADHYNNSKEFNEAVKILYNRYEAKLIKKDTAVNNLMKLQKAMFT